MIRFQVNEIRGDNIALSPHNTYLEALIYIIRRSTGHRSPGDETRVYQLEEGKQSIIVKIYTGYSYPSAEDLISAADRPCRTREFRSKTTISALE